MANEIPYEAELAQQEDTTLDAETGRRYSKEQIDSGVDFARSSLAKGYLSEGEFNAIVSAHLYFKQGTSSDADYKLLTKWAGHAEWDDMQEERDAKLRESHPKSRTRCT